LVRKFKPIGFPLIWPFRLPKVINFWALVFKEGIGTNLIQGTRKTNFGLVNQTLVKVPGPLFLGPELAFNSLAPELGKGQPNGSLGSLALKLLGVPLALWEFGSFGN